LLFHGHTLAATLTCLSARRAHEASPFADMPLLDAFPSAVSFLRRRSAPMKMRAAKPALRRRASRLRRRRPPPRRHLARHREFCPSPSRRAISALLHRRSRRAAASRLLSAMPSVDARRAAPA